MDGVIRNRNPKLEDEWRIKQVLDGIQRMIQFRETFGCTADWIDSMIYFILDQFPVYEGELKDGNVTEEWTEFEDNIPNYTLDEFYNRVIHPCNYKEEEK